jgi:ADP-ribose pyrophosphatase YjhB (NUDIX family)
MFWVKIEKMNNITRFTVRVYGLLVNNNNEVLLSKEKIGTFHFTKFPGGGLEFGEGIKDCLVREFKEEMNIDIVVEDHFYTTDFFQQSAFRESDQLLAIYYKVTSLDPLSTIRLDEFDIENNGRIEQQQFVWVPIHQLTTEIVTFPIDKLVVNMLKAACH